MNSSRQILSGFCIYGNRWEAKRALFNAEHTREIRRKRAYISKYLVGFICQHRKKSIEVGACDDYAKPLISITVDLSTEYSKEPYPIFVR